MSDQKQEQLSQSLTVLYLNFSGFSDLQKEIPSAGIAILMGQCFSLTEPIISLYDGSPGKYIGESVVAFFGLKGNHQNAAVNALKSAVEIQNKFSEMKAEGELPENLGLKIGIFSGEIFTAKIGTGTDQQENYFGETINLANQICVMASPGQILTGEETFKETKNYFQYHPLEPVPVKGYKKPLAIYEVTVKKNEPTQPPLQSGRIITSSMVGRRQDSRLLEEQIKQLLNGRGGVVTIEGIAGIGKSRLMAEIRQKEITTNVAFFEGRALSEGKNLSFHPIIQIIKSWSGIKEDDSPATSYQKLSQNIIRIYPEQATEIIPFVATMMGYTLEGEARQRVKGIEGEALERLILKNLRDLLSRAATLRPIVIMLEDSHWADLSSISFMESLFKLVKNHRLLFICVFRPGYKETGERLKAFVKENLSEHYREIVVKPLTEAESAELIGNLLNQTNLPNDIKQLIVMRSEGNPFFIEEVLRSFIDEGLIEIKDNAFIVTDQIQYANIPETIDKVILSRIDRLDEKTKGLLRTASVIGRNFYYKVLEEAAQTIEELDNRLEYLKEAQLLNEHKHKEDVEFLFKHALAQQATYDSILLKTKKELHLKIARSIEKVFANKLPEFYGVLAMHYDKAGVDVKKREYLIKAGDEAFRSGASNEAMNFYIEAIKLFPKEPESISEKENYKELEIKIGFAQQAAGNNIAAIETFQRIILKYFNYKITDNELILKSKGLFGMLLIMLKMNFQSFYFSREPDEKFNTYMKVLSQWGEALSTMNPKQFILQSLAIINNVLNYNLSKSVNGLSIFTECANLFMWTGISFKTSQKMLDYSKSAGAENHPGSLIDYRYTLKMHNFHTGQIEEDADFMNIYRTGLSVGDSWPTTIYSLYSGLICVELGKYDRLIEIIKTLDEISESFDNSHAKAQMYRLSSMAHYRFRKIDRALELSDEGIRYTVKTGHFAILLVIWCAKSLAHSAINELDTATIALAEAAKLVKDRKIITIYHLPYLQAKAQIELQTLRMALARNEKNLVLAQTLLKTIKQLISLSKKMQTATTEAYRLKAITCWLLGKQNAAFKNFAFSIQAGQKHNCHLELSRTYFEVGKCLRESDSIRSSLLGINGSEYLLKAKAFFEGMDLQWDLKEFEKYMEG